MDKWISLTVPHQEGNSFLSLLLNRPPPLGQSHHRSLFLCLTEELPHDPSLGFLPAKPLSS